MKKGLRIRLIFGCIILIAFTPVAHAFEFQYGPYFGFIANPDLNFSIRHLAFVDPPHYYQPSYQPPPMYLQPFVDQVSYSSAYTPAPYNYTSYQNQNYQQNYYQQPHISPVNQKPIAYPIQQQVVRAGQMVSFMVQGYDAENDYLRYTATNVPQGASFNEYTHTFSWMPLVTQVGQYAINFRVSEGGIGYADTSATIIVLDQNGAMPAYTCIAGPGPYFFNFNPSAIATEGDLYAYQITGVAGNNNQISYRVIDSPIGFTIGEKTGYMRWIPAFNQGRTQPYTVRIGMYNGVCESVQSFIIAVQDVR